MCNYNLLYASCPWLNLLQLAILKQPGASTPTADSTPSKLLPTTPESRVQPQLRENFFHHQPHTVRRVCEFVCERVHCNAVAMIQDNLSPRISEELQPAVRSWIDSQDVTELLESSLNSRLQFYLSTLVCQFRESAWLQCRDEFRVTCTEGASKHMTDLLPGNTERCVVDIARQLTVDKATEKCEMWWHTMASGFVDREVQSIAEVYMKRILSEVENTASSQGELAISLESIEGMLLRKGAATEEKDTAVFWQCSHFIDNVKNTVISNENTALFQRIADETVAVLIRSICELSVQIRTYTKCSSEKLGQLNCVYSTELDPIFDILLVLKDKKRIELPLANVPIQSLDKLFGHVPNDQDSMLAKKTHCERFVEVCMKLLYIGVLTPPRLEHWLLWFFEKSAEDEVRKISIEIMEKYRQLKLAIFEKRTLYIPGVAHFLKQYSMPDFEILQKELCKK